MCYGPTDSLHAYAGADLATWAALSDSNDAWERTLDAMLRWRTASGGGAELFSARSRDFGFNLPPHVTSSATLIDLIHNGILYDASDDTLRITHATRRQWWTVGGRMLAARTLWGRFDLAFGIQNDEAVWHCTRLPVWAIFRLPPGTRLSTSPAPPLRAHGSRAVMAPPGTTDIRAKCTPL